MKNSIRYIAGVRPVNDASAPTAYLKMTAHFTFGTANVRFFDTEEAAFAAAQREANRLTLALSDSFFPGVEAVEVAA